MNENDELWKKDTWGYLRENGAPLFAVIGALVNEYGEELMTKGYCEVLDVGCGEALVLPFLETNVSYLGFDISDYLIERNMKTKGRPNRIFKVDDWNDPTTPGEFDVVLMCGVLQDIPYAQRARFIEMYIEKYRPKVVIIETLQRTQLPFLRPIREYTMTLPLVDKDLPLGTKDVLNSRRILVIEGWKDGIPADGDSETAACLRGHQARGPGCGVQGSDGRVRRRDAGTHGEPHGAVFCDSA